MTDKIPEFKKEIDEIHVPIEKLDAIISEMSGKNSSKRKKSIRKKLLYTASTVAVAVGLLIGSTSVSPVMAKIISQIPLIGSIFSTSGDPGLEQVSNLGLTQTVGISQTAQGDTITIDEVFYDGTRFTVSYALESQKPLKKLYFENGSPTFTVDGKNVSYSSGISETEVTPTYRTSILTINAITALPEEFNLEMIFESDDRKWNLKIPVKAQTGVELVEINHTQQSEGVDLSVANLKISPAGLLIDFNAVADAYRNLFKTGIIDFHVTDELGNSLGAHSGSSKINNENKKVYQSGERLFDPISKDVKKLTITPYIIHSTGGGGVEIGLDGKETTIPFKPYVGKPIKFESFDVQLKR